ncbi:MAG: integration host factor subunit alpha [Desulfovibrionaceae bacterium]|nr:integration host factor subunit alpha [Desulfovibrionaceae bacterium]
MEQPTFTKASLVDAIYEKVGRNKTEIKDLVEEMLELMKTAIKKDHCLMLTGFGKFEVYQKPTRNGRNPKTAQVIVLPSRKVVSFRISRKFREELNSK